MIQLAGGEIRPLDGREVIEWIEFVLGRGAALAPLGNPAWLLCHCDDGVTWGLFEDNMWRLGSAYFPDLCPVPSALNVQELRVFFREAEVLIWRAAGFRGRILRDAASAVGAGRYDAPAATTRRPTRIDSFWRASSSNIEEVSRASATVPGPNRRFRCTSPKIERRLGRGCVSAIISPGTKQPAVYVLRLPVSWRSCDSAPRQSHI